MIYMYDLIIIQDHTEHTKNTKSQIRKLKENSDGALDTCLAFLMNLLQLKTNVI